MQLTIVTIALVISYATKSLAAPIPKPYEIEDLVARNFPKDTKVQSQIENLVARNFPKGTKLQSQIDDTVNVMNANIGRTPQRGESINVPMDKTSPLFPSAVSSFSRARPARPAAKPGVVSRGKALVRGFFSRGSSRKASAPRSRNPSSKQQLRSPKAKTGKKTKRDITFDLDDRDSGIDELN
ncbi:hypothetical protein M408DRAFT_329323 [Serendipita vermifera MAFF 305830]|uniref:V-SNARE coiled-coil homology domain-containing protein n=1 Tax=Serendipita vermifera MAFF 305830 TaxID=933852 RepID=A0A0C2WQL2_SERVB|nr:hypothetical protein M408DRAFT_329323 [Serendipita vermifera MAFF 305830]